MSYFLGIYPNLSVRTCLIHFYVLKKKIVYFKSEKDHIDHN